MLTVVSPQVRSACRPSLIRRLQRQAEVITSVLLIGLLFRSASAQDTSLGGFHGWVTDVAISPEATKLVSVGGQSLLYRPGDALVWDLLTGQQLRSLDGHECTVWSAALSPDGNSLATGGYDGSLKVWNLTNGEAREPAVKPGHWIRCLAYSPDGAWLVAGSEEGKLTIYDAASLNEVKTIDAHAGAIYGISFSPKDRLFATAGTDKLAKVWNQDTFEVAATLGKLPEPPAEKPEPSEESKEEPAKPAEEKPADDKPAEEKPANEKPVEEEPAQETPPAEETPQAVWSVAWSPDGGLVATAGADRKVRLWASSGEERAVLSGHRDWVTSVAFSSDGSQLASVGYDGKLILWDAATGKSVSTLEPNRGSLWTVAYSKDGNLLVAAGKQGIAIWRRGWQERTYQPAAGDGRPGAANDSSVANAGN